MDVFNVRQYGASGRGPSTDDRQAIQTAITACQGAGGGTLYFPAGSYYWRGTITLPGNMRVTGDGFASKLQPDNRDGEALAIAGSHVSLEHLRIEGSALVAIIVRNGVEDLLIRSVTFDGLGGTISHCLLLLQCQRVLVQDCDFHSCGYGVVQQKGFASNHVRVTGCTVRASFGDFVECNSATVDSRDWIIDHNRYLGSAQTGTEERFVGITRVENVSISDNHVYGVGGDSAIHLEGALGNLRITNNHFENCRVADGNLGWIYVTDSDKTMLVQGNTFAQTDPALPISYALDTSNSAIAPRIVFADNRVIAATGCAFAGVNLGFNSGSTDIRGNEFRGLQVGVRANSAQNVRIADNDFIQCGRGISASPDASSGSGGSNVLVRGNRFSGTGELCLETGRNSSGTGAPTGWVISDNTFDSAVRVGDGVDILATNNMVTAITTMAVNAIAHGGGQRVVERGTFVAGSGIKEGT